MSSFFFTSLHFFLNLIFILNNNKNLKNKNSYIDVFIGEYVIEFVIAKLAHCMSLLPNLR